MTHSTFAQPLPPNLAPYMSNGYKLASDEPRPFEVVGPFPAGSLSSTADDMSRFMLAHLHGGAYGDARILGEDTARMMHTTGQASVGPLNRMMLGFYETSVNGHRAIAHGGDTQWFHSDLQLFLDLGHLTPPDVPSHAPWRALVPAFMVGELRRAFEMGFLLYLPFLVIDMVVSSVLMSLGMMMLPPSAVSLPFKLVFFVLVDGWRLVAGSLVQSFAPG